MSRAICGRIRRLAIRGALALAVFTIALVAAAYVLPLPDRLHLADSAVMEYADGTPAHVFLSPDDKWRVRTRLAAVDKAYVEALVALEDKRFFSHLGVDPIAVVRAAWSNLSQRRVVSGASTITMQLVRLLEPRPRNLSSKLVEAFLAFQLELHLSKEAILEHYLRFIPYGRNIEGLQAASLGYFGHQADALTPAEIATLLAVPQAPSTRYPHPEHQSTLRRGRDKIAERVLPEAAGQIREAAVPTAFRPFPREAPHLAYWLREQFPHSERLPSTLDRGAQQIAARLMASAGSDLVSLGVMNGVAVIVEHSTGDVRALVGSFDFGDAENGGQIPGFAVPRSPGSALKPLVYAMAIDGGLALPEFLVPDVPVRYGTYEPTNYDGSFRGVVRLDEALSRSLNIPFVVLLGQLGVDRFLGSLRTMGVESLSAQPGYYGLSAAVGGIELSPLELAGVYATLAQNGEARPVRVLRSPKVADPLRVFSPGAAWLTRRALSKRDRPDFPARRRITETTPKIHWKTGTSFGNRDAWAAGSGPVYTGVVWTGNFDRRPSAALVGSKVAAPILFDLLEALGEGEDAATRGDERPADLVEVEVCAYSGHVPTAACHERRRALAVSSRVPTARDPYHLSLEVISEGPYSGLAVTPDCRAGRVTERRSFVTWPSSVRRYLSDQQRYLPEPPELAPGCAPAGHGEPPRIVSPPERSTVLLIPGLTPSRQSVLLEADTSAPGERLYWFVDGEFLGDRAAHERLYWSPKSGEHRIVVTDARGRSADRLLRVRAL